MDDLADPIVDTLPFTYPDFPNRNFREGNSGYVFPDPSCTVSERVYEPMLPRERRTEPTTFAISTTFNLQMNVSADEETDSDVVLVSRDAVHFFVHRNRLLSASSSRFAFLLDPYVDQATSQTIQVTEDAQTLNVMLHVIYNISFHLYSPPLEILLQAIRTFEKYGLTLDMHILPGTPLFEDIVLKTPCQPLEVYLIAAEYDLFELARAASGYLLSTSLLFLPEAAILRLNVEYLSMLYNLHKLRTMVLQHLVSQPPDGHEPKFHCGFSECQAMRSAWSVTASMFVLQANPDVSAALIRNTLESLKFSLPCMQCQQCVQRRVNEVLLKWSITPRTICRQPRDFFADLIRENPKGKSVVCESDESLLSLLSLI